MMKFFSTCFLITLICLCSVAAEAQTYDFMTLERPASEYISPYDLSGNVIVGEFGDANVQHGFLYDGINWDTLDYPDAVRTAAYGIDGETIVGYFMSPDDRIRGFLYDGVNWDALDYPDAADTFAHGIDGQKIVGAYYDQNYKAHGFVYDGANNSFSPLDYPGAADTFAHGIDAGKIVGVFFDEGGNPRGFQATPRSEQTIIIDGCDSGVKNVLLVNGSLMSDLISQCAANPKYHWKYVMCVVGLTNSWKKAGLISDKEKFAIQRCAARANIPYSPYKKTCGKYEWCKKLKKWWENYKNR